MNKVRIGVLVSGRGSNLQAVIDNIEQGKLSAVIAVVISDQADAFALERAKQHGIPAIHLSPRGYQKKREEYDAMLVSELRKHAVDLVILAGFMRIVTKPLVGAFPNRIMNIHPALLPSFPGLHVQRAAIDHGVKFSGCTVHFVDEGMDTGPIIIQAVVPVLDNDNEDALAARILTQEHNIFSRAIQLFAEGRLKVQGRRVLVEGGRTDSDDVLINP
jgi:phosphoribosylglycinamide formyltransferase-1